MIANYKPASRTVGVISALILAATAWVVLTGAADKPVAVAPAQREGTASGAESPRAQPQHLAHLENELNKLKRQLREQAAVVDRLREELEISPLEESSQATDPELLRKMESMRVEQAAEYEQVRNLHKALSELPRKELLRALPTAAPDALLLSLIEQHTRAEQSVTETLHTHGAEHPSARTAKRTLEQIETQMDQRLEGILEGLSVRMRSAQATREHLEQEASKMKSSQIERTITSRPYFRAKRELEILEGLYDTLRQRFIQAQIDAGPPAPPSSK